MSQKFVLVPYDTYRNEPSTIMQSTKQQMNEIMSNESLDDSEKNLLYYTQLHNYIKQKKDADRKPIKVEISNLPNMQPTILNRFINKQAKKNRRPIVMKKGVPVAVTEDDDDDEEEEINIEPETLDRIEEVHMPAAPEPEPEPSTSKPELRKEPPTKTKKEAILQETGQALYDYIRKNKETFKVSDDDVIIDMRDRAINDSDLKDVVRYMVAESVGLSSGEHVPKGYPAMRLRIDKDNQCKRILKDGLTKFKSQKGSGLFKPDKWRRK